MKIKLLIITATFCALAVSQTVNAQAAKAVTEIVEVGLRKILQTGAQQAGERAAAELAEVGGEQAVRAIVMQAAREGGEEVVEKLAANAGRYGVTLLKGAKNSPTAFVRAWEKLPENLRAGALAELRREPELIAGAMSKAGTAATDVLAAAGKNPGVSTQIMKNLGSESASVVKNLATDEAVLLAKHAPAVAKVATAAERQEFLAMVQKAPTKVLSWLERHPKVLLTSAAFVAFLATKDELLGTKDNPGFIERTVGKPVVMGAWIAAAILCIGFGGWMLIRLRGAHRVVEAKVRRAEQKNA